MNRLEKKHLFLILLLCVTLTGCSLFGSPDIIVPSDPSEDDGSTGGQSPAYGSLAGTVYDVGLPEAKLQSGKVEIGGQVVSIKDGAYVVNSIPNGTYTMRVTKQWYKPKEITVTINGSTIQDVAMVPDLTLEELETFAGLVSAESKGEPYIGQVAVAATVLNRVLDPNYPNTITQVIKQVIWVNGIAYYQYEPVKNGTYLLPAEKSAKNAVRHALAGWDPTKGATGFFAHDKVPQWSNGKVPWVWQQWNKDPYKIRIGNHSFFR